MNIVTKRGKYKSREINFSYDHGFNSQTRIPKMADASTYANAINEALANDGKSARYSQNELNAFKSGKYPYLYPNVNWMDEVFRDQGTTDIATLTFRGGSTKMRYFTMLNLQNNRGFIKNANSNDGYSTHASRKSSGRSGSAGLQKCRIRKTRSAMSHTVLTISNMFLNDERCVKLAASFSSYFFMFPVLIRNSSISSMLMVLLLSPQVRPQTAVLAFRWSFVKTPGAEHPPYAF